MSNENSALIYFVVGVLATLGVFGLFIVSMILGYVTGRQNAIETLRKSHWLISRKIIPADDDVIVVNLTTKTIYGRKNRDLPRGITVRQQTGSIDIQEGGVRYGVPVDEAEEEIPSIDISNILKQGVN